MKTLRMKSVGLVIALAALTTSATLAQTTASFLVGARSAPDGTYWSSGASGLALGAQLSFGEIIPSLRYDVGGAYARQSEAFWNLSTTELSGGVVYTPDLGWPGKVYGGAGIAGIHDAVSIDYYAGSPYYRSIHASSNGVGAYVKAGATYPIGERWSVGAEVRYLSSFTGGAAWSAGHRSSLQAALTVGYAWGAKN